MSDDLPDEFEEAAQGAMPEFQPTNAPAKKFLVIDDKMEILWSMFESDLSEHIDIEFQMTNAAWDAMQIMEADGVPDVIMLDAFNLRDVYFGYNNACQIIEWLKENHPDRPLPDIIFSSGELDYSEDNATRLYATHGVVAGITCKNEFSRVEWGLDGRDPSHLSYSHTGTAIRKTLNVRCGLDLPLTNEGLKKKFYETMKSSGDFTLEMLESMVDAGEMTALEALQKVKPRLLQEIDNYIAGQKEPPVAFNAQPVDGFLEAVGNWSAGPAALSLTEADDFITKAEKPILVVNQFTPEIYPYLTKVAGVIVKSPELCGHAAIELGAWGVSALIGYGGGDLDNVKSGEPLALDTRFKGLYRTSIDKSRLDDFRYNQCPFYNSTESYYIYRWQQQLMQEYGIKDARQTYTIDSMQQVDDINFGHCGAGLVRSESLIKEDAEALRAVKEIILSNGGTADKNEFFRSVQENVQKLLSRGRDGKMLRYRLLDIPPSEIFSSQELDQIEKSYGDRNIRGVQMGLAVPALYETQIRAVFAAIQQIVQENIQFRADYPDATPNREQIEIFVPTVKTAEELEQIKIMVADIAAEYGLTKANYSFGTMVEMLGACDDIEDIAKLCDFISFGINDLTEAVLGVKRDDMLARIEAAQRSRQTKEPYQMIYPQVLEKMHETITRARVVKPEISIGVCGSGSSDVKSFVALHDLAVDSISMQPGDDNFTILPILAAFEMAEQYEKRKQKLETTPPAHNMP
ncbi:MAG: hypothetical protein GC136_04540 [Alphaproteobacteria bacterium]|nr:hypothetical protein [Alphaproteobacteria bacterium]